MPLYSDATLWDADTLVRNRACETCNQESFNHWQVCVRKSAAVNLHVEYVARSRQCWFVAMLPMKYLIVPAGYTGPVFDFKGLEKPLLRTFTLPDTSLPKNARQAWLLSLGMTHIVLAKIMTHKLFDFECIS